METMIPGGRINVYFGLSTDEKKTVHVPNGSIYYEMDTGDAYFFNADDSEWLLKQ